MAHNGGTAMSNSIDRSLESNFRSAYASMDRSAVPMPMTVQDMTDFVDHQTLAKLSAWAATTQLGLKHKLTDMAIQAVK
jgi:hypothetical protein